MNDEYKTGRFRPNKARLSPQEIIDREMPGMTQSLDMTDIKVPDVTQMQEGSLPPGVAERQADLDDAMRMLASVMKITVSEIENQTENPHVKSYRFSLKGRKPDDRLNDGIFNADTRCVEAKWIVSMFISMAGGLS